MTDVTFTIRLTGEDRGGEAAVRKVVTAVQQLQAEATQASKAVQAITTGAGAPTAAPAIDQVVRQVEAIGTAEREAADAALAMATATEAGAAKAAAGQKEAAAATEQVVEALDRTGAAATKVADTMGRDIPAAAQRAGAGLVSAFRAPDADLAKVIETFNALQTALAQGPAGFAQAKQLAAELQQQTEGVTASLGELTTALVQAGGSTADLPDTFFQVAAAARDVEQAAAKLNTTIGQGTAESFPAATQGAEDLRQSLESLLDVSDAVGKAEESTGTKAKRGTEGVGKLERAFHELIFSATGIPGVVGRTAAALSQFAAGGAVTAAVVAGLGVLTATWRKLTQELRKNRDEANQTSDALVNAALGNAGLDIGQSISKIQTELDDARSRLKESRGPLNQFDVLASLGFGKTRNEEIQQTTTDIGKYSLAIAELRKQLVQFHERAAAAKGDAFLANLEAERQRVTELSAQVERAATEDFNQGKLSVEEFFAARREAMASAFDAELKAAKAQANELGRRAAVELAIDPRTPEATNAVTAAAAARAQVDQLALRRKGELLQLTQEQVATERAVVDRVNEFNAGLLEAKGNLEAASLNRLETQIRDARTALEQFGLSADEIERRLTDFRATRTTQIRLDAVQQAIDRAFAETDRLKSEVQAQIDAGLITEREGNRQILEIERSRLPVLAALKAQLLAIAATLTDPAARQAVQNLVTELDNATTAAGRTGRAALDLELELRNVAESQLVNFLTTTAAEAHSVGDAFKQFARDAVSAINEVIARIIVMKALDAAGFGFSGGGSVPQKKATGGLVFGPRHPVDQVPVWLTGGEYVFDTKAVNRAGVPFLRALHVALRDGLSTPTMVRPNRLPGHFAEGGLVADGASPGAGGRDRIDLNVGLDDGMVLRSLETNAGVRTLLRVIANNPKSFNGALGR